ncbi:MAG TPA: hypothetical protein ENN90_14785 [Mariniphaga anaerophila]|uniref:Uncharacterized protein n=1 Tax=Mariniphaga anaerophila TaxID=1484053 RepID=A0A831LYN6_9BACT|nr:hypothetical protein [Mariniphaga anaerophila]
MRNRFITFIVTGALLIFVFSVQAEGKRRNSVNSFSEMTNATDGSIRPYSKNPWIEIQKISVKWLDVASLSWSDEQIMEAKWDNFDGTDWWGPQRILKLAPKDYRSYVAIVKVMD